MSSDAEVEDLLQQLEGVRAGSFDFFPELKSRFSDSAFDRDLTRSECLAGSLRLGRRE